MNNTTNNETNNDRYVTRNGKTFANGDILVCTRKHSPCFGMMGTLVENGRCNQGTMMVACDDTNPSNRMPVIVEWGTYDGGSAMTIDCMDWSHPTDEEYLRYLVTQQQHIA
jgi:hypothetical protein